MAFVTSREHFQLLAEQALGGMPDEFRKYFINITVIIEDYPTKEECRKLGVRRKDLLGLFRGTEYPQRDKFFDIPSPFPDEVILFKKNIEAICTTEKELIEEIRLTLVHELGHYFGLSEEDLRRYE
jgi:predicted Zn-dependent protease with MMP-like domain